MLLVPAISAPAQVSIGIGLPHMSIGINVPTVPELVPVPDSPAYFRGWRSDGPPRWGDHWGSDWTRRRAGWDQWDRHTVPRPAPLPVYQRNFQGRQYPGLDRQHEIHAENYHHQPQEPVVRDHYAARAEHGRSAPNEEHRGEERREEGPKHH
jgi:hypothetical protein